MPLVLVLLDRNCAIVRGAVRKKDQGAVAAREEKNVWKLEMESTNAYPMYLTLSMKRDGMLLILVIVGAVDSPSQCCYYCCKYNYSAHVRH